MAMNSDMLKYGCKQFVAVIKNRFNRQFMVFTSGDPKYYLFSAIDNQGIAVGIPSFPVLKKDLRDDIRHALLHGCGNSNIDITN